MGEHLPVAYNDLHKIKLSLKSTFHIETFSVPVSELKNIMGHQIGSGGGLKMKYRKWHMQMSAGPLGEFTVSAPQHCPPLHSQIPLVFP